MSIIEGSANEIIKSNSIADLINGFLSCRAKTTIAAYSSDLQTFANFLEVAGINEAAKVLLAGIPGQANVIALQYKAHLIKKGDAPATVNRRLAALRSLTKLSRVTGLINWELEVENQRHEQYRDTRGIGLEGVQKVIQLFEGRHDKRSLRDYCLVRLLFDLALRRQEIINIDVGDLDLAQSTVTVLSKGRLEKHRMSLPSATVQAIQKWLAVRGNEPGPLFCPLDRAYGKSIRRLTGTGLYKIMKKYGSSVHAYRHTAITECCKVIAENGLGIESLVKFSRHKNLNTALVYMDHLEDRQSQLSALVANQIKK